MQRRKGRKNKAAIIWQHWACTMREKQRISKHRPAIKIYATHTPHFTCRKKSTRSLTEHASHIPPAKKHQRTRPKSTPPFVLILRTPTHQQTEITRPHAKGNESQHAQIDVRACMRASSSSVRLHDVDFQ